MYFFLTIAMDWTSCYEFKLAYDVENTTKNKWYTLAYLIFIKMLPILLFNKYVYSIFKSVYVYMNAICF